MYTILYHSVLLVNIFMWFINHGLSICYVSSTFQLICVYIRWVVAIYRCSTWYVVVLLTVIMCTCIQSYLFEFCFELPQYSVLFMMYLCAMYLWRYGSFADVLGELWLSIDIFNIIWQLFSLSLFALLYCYFSWCFIYTDLNSLY
jgi:hypothetical protein